MIVTPPQPPANYLSWTADGRTLAYDWPASSYVTVSLLDPSAPGSSLAVASRPVPAVKTDGSNVIISPDGARIIYATLWANPSWGIVEVSAQTHQPANALGSIPLSTMPGLQVSYPDLVSQILWSNPSGSVLIVKTTADRLGVLGHGHFTKLPATMPFNPSAIAW